MSATRDKSYMASTENNMDEGDYVDTSQKPGKRKRKDVETDSGSTRLETKKTNSTVWEHFSRKSDDRKSVDSNRASCNYCEKEMSCKSIQGTSTMKRHLIICKQHQIFRNKKEQTVLTSVEGDGLKLGKIGEKVFRDACNKLLVVNELPLSFIEIPGWKDFCSTVHLHRPHSRRTATRDIVETYVRKKSVIKKLLADNKQRLSLTTDIWVAPHTGASYMVITAHFVDSTWQLRKLIIGFKSIGDHKGESICNVLLECLSEWSIEKVFCIIVDNATANTSALRKFKDRFMAAFGNDALVLNGDYLHVRCATHILNLVVKDGLQEVDNSVAAIRNGIQFVRSSTNRLKSFELRVDTGKISRGSLPLDVKTRWNSTFLMLETAMKFRIAFTKMEEEDKPYNEYFKENVEGSKRVGPPTDGDWESVEVLVKVLDLFYKSTMVLSASTSACSHKCYNLIVTIVKKLRSYTMGSNVNLLTKAEAMLRKIDKYWNPLDDMNKLLIVATVFNPSKRMAFVQLCFEKLYGKDSVQALHLNNQVMDILKQLFEKYSGFANESGLGSESGISSVQPSQSQECDGGVEEDMDCDNSFETFADVFEKLSEETGFQDSINELELYLKEKVENPKIMKGSEYDVLSWWKRHSLKFPVLSLIARDVLAMQVSSVASESAFSTSGRILNPCRSCLTHEMIEVLMCLQQWLKNEVYFNEKGIQSTLQMLSDIQLQDDLMREFGVIDMA